MDVEEIGSESFANDTLMNVTAVSTNTANQASPLGSCHPISTVNEPGIFLFRLRRMKAQKLYQKFLTSDLVN